MTKEQFITILKNPSVLKNEHVFDIEDMIHQYPFFQPLRALHLKGLKNQNSFRYNQALKTTAIYTADRSVLFTFITQTDFTDSQSQLSEEAIINDIELVDLRVIESLQNQDDTLEISLIPEEEQNINEKLNEIFSLHQIVSPKPEDTLAEEKNVEVHTKQNEEDIADEVVETKVETDNTDEEPLPTSPEQYLWNTTQARESITDEVDDLKQDTILDYQDFNSALAQQYQEKNLENQEQEVTKAIENETDYVENEIVFELLPDEIFTETFLEKSEPEAITPESTTIPDIRFDEELYTSPVHFNKDDTFSFSQWLNLSHFKPIDRAKEVNESKEQKLELIDQFISTNPKIEPIKKDTIIKPVQNSNETDSEEVMTETLARVYVLQQKYDEAIRAYEILSLKFPEKNTFFATQIKQIEILRKNR